MTQHTPTPWKAEGNRITAHDSYDADPWNIAETFGATPNSDGGSENAEFIVTAVNSHEELLEALEGAAKDCHICDGKGSYTLMDETEICQSPGSSRQDCQFCAPYRAAIKSARVQQ